MFIVIPIYNASKYLSLCLSSVLKHREPHDVLLLIDDASTDPKVDEILSSTSLRHKNIIHLRNSTNIGFVNSINHALQNVPQGHDILLLNSDTIVTKGFTHKLQSCLNSAHEVGICSPLSNNATILSIPESYTYNYLKYPLTIDQMAEKVCDLLEYIEIPVAIGFCMAIKKTLLDSVGAFDSLFSPGYGEECDFSLRAKALGYKILACTNCYVWHFGSRSFDLRSNELKEKHSKILEDKYPEYNNSIKRFIEDEPLKKVCEVLKKSGKKKILQVLHDYNMIGGTELHTVSMIEENKKEFDFKLIWPNKNIKIKDLEKDLKENSYDIVHLQHYLNWTKQSYPLAEMIKRYTNKLVVSVHDTYLIEEANTPKKTALDLADVIITPSHFIFDKVLKIVGESNKNKVRFIPHGTNIRRNVEKIPRIKRNHWNIAFLGAFCKHKGADHFLEVAKHFDCNGRFWFSIIGFISNLYEKDVCEANIKQLGQYKVEDLPELTKEIDIICILSEVEESFCLTLLEAQSLGIPVIVTNRGALPERVQHNVTGFISQSPSETVKILNNLVAMPVPYAISGIDYATVKNNLENMKPYTLRDNALEYKSVYDAL